jgi:hypothetical protein
LVTRRFLSGIQDEQVKDRELVSILSNGKTFRGANTLRSRQEVATWLENLAGELFLRMSADREANQRVPTQITTGIGFDKENTQRNSQNINVGNGGSAELFGKRAVQCADRLFAKRNIGPSDSVAVTSLWLSLGIFQPLSAQKQQITNFFTQNASRRIFSGDTDASGSSSGSSGSSSSSSSSGGSGISQSLPLNTQSAVINHHAPISIATSTTPTLATSKHNTTFATSSHTNKSSGAGGEAAALCKKAEDRAPQKRKKADQNAGRIEAAQVPENTVFHVFLLRTSHPATYFSD